MEKYPRVAKARMENDTEALKRFAHAGGVESSRRKRARKQALQRLADELARLYSLSPDGDVLPPEPTE